MPSLDAVYHNSRTPEISSDPHTGDRLGPVPGDAVDLSEQLSAFGIACFLLGIGITFFFDSVLGTIAYTLTLGQVAYGILRVIVVTVPPKDLPWILAWASGAPMVGRPATLREWLAARVSRRRARSHGLGTRSSRLGTRRRLHTLRTAIQSWELVGETERDKL